MFSELTVSITSKVLLTGQLERPKRAEWVKNENKKIETFSSSIPINGYACSQLLSHVCLLATLWTVACQAPLSMGFSRQEYWSELPCPSPGHLPNLGSNPCLLHYRQILYHLSHQGSPVLSTWHIVTQLNILRTAHCGKTSYYSHVIDN